MSPDTRSVDVGSPARNGGRQPVAAEGHVSPADEPARAAHASHSTAEKKTAFRTRPHVGGSPFPPISSYGFISDCHVNALIAPSGNVEWLCLPRPDSASVFGSILDRAAGGFCVRPS